MILQQNKYYVVNGIRRYVYCSIECIYVIAVALMYKGERE